MYYALLAENTSETIKVLQKAKLAEELSESKTPLGREDGGTRVKQQMAEGVEKLSE